MGSAAASDLLGYISIASWLGAQFPQVLENIRNQSCEGLALPFLANWLLGDLSNLVGCILTHQLPFQTWLAVYFCFVDFTLLGQYFYYSSRQPAIPGRPHFPTRSRTQSHIRRASIDRGAPTPHYRALSTVAANVAAAAALAAQQHERDTGPPDVRYSRHRLPRHSVDHLPGAVDDEDVDEEALAALADSFHSEGGATARRARFSFNLEHERALHVSTADLGRGRSLQRDVPEGDEHVEGEFGPVTESPSATLHRTSSRASRRGAGMVFLGVGALYALNTLAVARRGIPSSSLGRVLESDPPPPDHDEPLSELVIGRIFAWLCTTMYLTCRLPQIWKNYSRKSVEGLSMFLFFFAFLGNTFYVASILTSPKMDLPPSEASAYLKESIPYLLGSSGTLCFDVTILTQSLIYRPRPHHKRTTTLSVRDEEQAGLLQEDPEPHMSPRAASRSKSRTSSI